MSISESSTRGITRWRRSGLIAVPAGAAVAAMAVAVLQGAMAVNLAVSNKPLVVTSTQPVVAKGGIAALMGSVNNTAGTNGRSTLHAGIGTAEIADVCVRVTQTVPIINKAFTLVIKAGSGEAGSIIANNVVADAEAVTGDARIDQDGAAAVNTVVGLDAAGLDESTDRVSGGAGDFALRTNGKATITELWAQAAAATVAGSVKAENLDLKIVGGDQTAKSINCPTL